MWLWLLAGSIAPILMLIAVIVIIAYAILPDKILNAIRIVSIAIANSIKAIVVVTYMIMQEKILNPIRRKV